MSTEVWLDPRWRAGAEEWIDGVLETHSLTRVGAVTYAHVRPWSVVAHLSVGGDRFWFKASAAETAYEPTLLGLLAGVTSALLPPLGLDRARGWSLHPDGGRTLRDMLASRPADRLALWEDVLQDHARLQLAAARLSGQLLEAGVPDMRPAVLTRHVERLLTGSTLTAGLRARVASWLPQLQQAAAELASSMVPMTVQHDDLHDNNVLIADRGVQFVDWGDASIGHPFGVFLVIRRSVAHQAGWDEHGPELCRLRDAYLEPFTQFGSRRALERELEVATYLDGVARVESWRRALADATSQEVAAYEDPVGGWLDEIVGLPLPGAAPM